MECENEGAVTLLGLISVKTVDMPDGFVVNEDCIDVPASFRNMKEDKSLTSLDLNNSFKIDIKQPPSPKNAPNVEIHLKRAPTLARIQIFHSSHFEDEEKNFGLNIPSVKNCEPTPTFPENNKEEISWDNIPAIKEFELEEKKSLEITGFGDYSNIERDSGGDGTVNDIPILLEIKNSADTSENHQEVHAEILNGDAKVLNFSSLYQSENEISILPQDNETIIINENSFTLKLQPISTQKQFKPKPEHFQKPKPKKNLEIHHKKPLHSISTHQNFPASPQMSTHFRLSSHTYIQNYPQNPNLPCSSVLKLPKPIRSTSKLSLKSKDRTSLFRSQSKPLNRLKLNPSLTKLLKNPYAQELKKFSIKLPAKPDSPVHKKKKKRILIF